MGVFALLTRPEVADHVDATVLHRRWATPRIATILESPPTTSESQSPESQNKVNSREASPPTMAESQNPKSQNQINSAEAPKNAGKLNMDEVMGAAMKDALEEDPTCVKGPSMINPNLPGIRYGVSTEMRPLSVVLPCPCAGGQWTPPYKDDVAQRGADGMWGTSPRPGSAMAGMRPPILSHLWTGAVPEKSQSNVEQEMSGRPTEKAMATSLLVGSVAGSMGLPAPYKPGTEPYSVDFGCAYGLRRRPTGQLDPGYRWTRAAGGSGPWQPIIVATPCPCAMGVFTSLEDPKIDPLSPTSPPLHNELQGNGFGSLPPWQMDGGSTLMGGFGGTADRDTSAALLAAVPVRCRGVPSGFPARGERKWTLECFL